MTDFFRIRYPFIALLIACLIIACTSDQDQATTATVDEVNPSSQTETAAPATADRVDPVDPVDPSEYDAELRQAKAVKFICYTNDANTDKRIWIGFDKSQRGVLVKYEGQSESIPLRFVSEDYRPGGTQPTIITTYDEIYRGEVNGQYTLTKSGNWYYVSYERGRDGKTFTYTIDHMANPLGSAPCFT